MEFHGFTTYVRRPLGLDELLAGDASLKQQHTLLKALCAGAAAGLWGLRACGGVELGGGELIAAEQDEHQRSLPRSHQLPRLAKNMLAII